MRPAASGGPYRLITSPDSFSRMTQNPKLVTSIGPDDDLASLARDHLAPYKVPVRYEVIDELPRNEVGKVRAPDLLARARGVAEP